MATNLVKGQRTLLGSKSVKGSWYKSGSGYWDGDVYYGTAGYWVGVSGAYTLSLYATLTDQNISNKSSTIKFEHVISTGGTCNFSGYSSARSIVRINGTDNTSYQSQLGYGGTPNSVTKTWERTFVHQADGTIGEVSVSARWRSFAADSDSDYSGTSNPPANNTLGTYYVDVPDLKISDTLEVSDTTIAKDGSVTFSTPNISGLYTKCVYSYGSTTKQLWAKLGSASVTKTYDQLKADFGFADYATGVITATLSTYSTNDSSGTVIGTSEVKVYLQGRAIPISLFQDGESTGVSIGQEASTSGFYVNGVGPFTIKELTIGGTTYKVLATEV